MEIRPILVRGSAGEGKTKLPDEFKDYCRDLGDLPPSTEIYLSDPDYDNRTLHSSIGFRDAIVRERTVKYDDLAVEWSTPTQHEINDDGSKWTKVMGTGLMYTVTYKPRAAKGKRSNAKRMAAAELYVCIQFGDRK